MYAFSAVHSGPPPQCTIHCILYIGYDHCNIETENISRFTVDMHSMHTYLGGRSTGFSKFHDLSRS